MVDELKTVRVYRCRLRDFGISCDVDVSGERLTWSFSSKRIGLYPNMLAVFHCPHVIFWLHKDLQDFEGSAEGR
jgi:hypothetical protein